MAGAILTGPPCPLPFCVDCCPLPWCPRAWYGPLPSDLPRPCCCCRRSGALSEGGGADLWSVGGADWGSISNVFVVLCCLRKTCPYQSSNHFCIGIRQRFLCDKSIAQEKNCSLLIPLSIFCLLVGTSSTRFIPLHQPLRYGSTSTVHYFVEQRVNQFCWRFKREWISGKQTVTFRTMYGQSARFHHHQFGPKPFPSWLLLNYDHIANNLPFDDLLHLYVQCSPFHSF